MKNKLYKIQNGTRIEIKTAELDKHKNIITTYYSDKFEETKKNKIEKLTEKTEKIFYDKYPLHKQCNIAIFGTGEEREEFKRFHDTEVAKYDEQIGVINSCTDLEQLDCLEL